MPAPRWPRFLCSLGAGVLDWQGDAHNRLSKPTSLRNRGIATNSGHRPLGWYNQRPGLFSTRFSSIREDTLVAASRSQRTRRTFEFWRPRPIAAILSSNAPPLLAPPPVAGRVGTSADFSGEIVTWSGNGNRRTNVPSGSYIDVLDGAAVLLLFTVLQTAL